VKAGAFYSPFVKDYRERIQSEGHWISKDDLVRCSDELFHSVDRFGESEYGGITKFEFEAAMGFKYWGDQRCEWVALEVGLGGRLDATNVVVPKCAVIVSIGMDHVAILGDTVEAIAFEKAGIIKAGIPVVVGELPTGAMEVVDKVATNLGCDQWRFGHEIFLNETSGGYTVRTPEGEYSHLVPGLIGQKQPHNMALAIAALEASGFQLDPLKVRTGVAEAYAPARFERVTNGGVLFVVDGAHNADAGEALVWTLEHEYGDRSPWVLVANSVTGHDSQLFYKALSGRFDHVFIAPIHSIRAVSVEEGQAMASEWFENPQGCTSLREALDAAKDAAGGNGLVVVTGSNYLAGEALAMCSGG
jgi:dihydrofolate synthase/folylpolyglutamate synthase